MFLDALSLYADPMNTPNGSTCWTNSYSFVYQVPTDAAGNSVLTGEGAGEMDHGKKFTCIELEVFLVV